MYLWITDLYTVVDVVSCAVVDTPMRKWLEIRGPGHRVVSQSGVGSNSLFFVAVRSREER